jgi:hypothetical protein
LLRLIQVVNEFVNVLTRLLFRIIDNDVPRHDPPGELEEVLTVAQ